MDELEDLIENLSEDEKKVLHYFIKNISVGEIIAVKELKLIYNINKPEIVLDSLLVKGLIEKAPGCFNLSKKIREILKKRSKKPTMLT